MQVEIDAAGEREAALAVKKAAAGEMKRRERGRAGGVDGQARPVQVELIGNAIGDRPVGCCPIDGVALLVLLDRDELVLAVHHAREDADVPLAVRHQPIAAVARILHRLVGDLEEQPRLRVHRHRIAGGNVEKKRIEAVDRPQEAAPLGIGASGNAPARIEQPVVVPALLGDLADAVPAGCQIPPELLQVVGLGEASRDADDGDALVR